MFAQLYNATVRGFGYQPIRVSFFNTETELCFSVKPSPNTASWSTLAT